MLKDNSLAIIKWYPFSKGKKFFINAPQSVIDEYGNDEETVQGKYDYVLLFDDITRLQEAKDHLEDSGKLIMILDNYLGIRFFCGEKRTKELLKKSEILERLEKHGFSNIKFYSVFPNYNEAQLIYAEDTLPRESMQTRYIPKYNSVDNIFLEENKLCDDLANEGVLHKFANSFFIECSFDDKMCLVKNATLSLDRGKKKSMVTLVYPDIVIKKAAFLEGIETLDILTRNMTLLKKRGIKVVDFSYSNGKVVMPFVDAELANVYLRNLLFDDKNLFLKRMDEFYDLIHNSSEIVSKNECGDILKNGFLDLVPLNCFWDGQQYIVFDQEYCEPNIPVNVIMLRTLVIIFDGIPNPPLSMDFLYKRYGMIGCLEKLYGYVIQFVNSLRSDDEIQEYNNKHQIFPNQIKENYNRLFYSKSQDKSICALMKSKDKVMENLLKEYKKNCFNVEKYENIYIWGTGKWADKFICLYKNEMHISAVIDNDQKKQGGDFYGYKVCSPEKLLKMDNSFKVIICVKNCIQIVEQLVQMGIFNIGVYDANYTYSLRSRQTNLKTEKKYHIGYLSGVFDLYHIGHINMFRRAKEMCDYLIVGVTSDEYVINKKKRTPFIPFEERLQVVAACKYVDKAVGVPYMHEEITEAWEKYHYDVQFCGSDYETNPWWLEQQKWLREHGSDLVFFPYTQQTSSTKIKSLIDKGLL